MSFQSSAFQNSGFQTDGGAAPLRPYPGPAGRSRRGKRRLYELQGKQYFLNERELEHLLALLAERREVPKPARVVEGAAVIAVPAKWEPPAAIDPPPNLLRELVFDAVRLDAPEVLWALQRMRADPDDDDIAMLLLYS